MRYVAQISDRILKAKKTCKWMLDFQIHRRSSTNPLARWATSAWCHLWKARNANCQMFNDWIWFSQADSNQRKMDQYFTFELKKINILQHLWFCHNLWPPVDDAHSAPLADSIVHAAMKRPERPVWQTTPEVNQCKLIALIVDIGLEWPSLIHVNFNVMLGSLLNHGEIPEVTRKV